MADTDIPFLLTLGKPETQTLRGSVIGKFSVRLILKKWQPFFNVFIMADTDIPFLLTLGKPETQTLRGSVIGKFSVRSILKKWQPFKKAQCQKSITNFWVYLTSCTNLMSHCSRAFINFFPQQKH